MNGYKSRQPGYSARVAFLREISAIPVARYAKQRLVCQDSVMEASLTLYSDEDHSYLTKTNSPSQDSPRRLPYSYNADAVDKRGIAAVLARTIGFRPANEAELTDFIKANAAFFDDLVAAIKLQVEQRNDVIIQMLLKERKESRSKKH